MKSILKVAVCLCATLFFVIYNVRAQLNVPKFQFGINAGVFVYQGDLTPSPIGSYKTLRPLINLFASKLFSPSFALRGNFVFGGLKGDDAKYEHPGYRQERNFKFNSLIAELSGLAEWSILGRNYISRGFAPYVFAGAGFSLLRIRRDFSRLNVEHFGSESELVTGLTTDVLRPLPRALLILPVGIGARYYLTDKIGVSAETSYRLMSSDYLDGFSQAANPSKGDHYYSHTVGVVYRIGKKNTLACPVIAY